MENLLNKLNHFKTCTICGQHKALSEFLSGHDENKKAIYSDICYVCRSNQSTEDDSTHHGKKLTLALNSEVLQQLQEAQEEQQTEKQLEQNEYIEEQDRLAEKETQEKEKGKELLSESESEAAWNKDKKDDNSLTKSVLAAHIFNEKVNTEAIQNLQSQIQENINQSTNSNTENEKARPISADGMRHIAKYKHMMLADRLDVKNEQQRDSTQLGKKANSNLFNNNTKQDEPQNTPSVPMLKTNNR